jgi:1-deoxy-D-xylulose-5-phosphate reductoisomerase
MGKKITVDSATMMNKAFEVIEAYHLFNLPAEKIDVLIHPEAVVHGMVELTDGTIKGIFSVPDMKLPISFVLNYPYRNRCCRQRIDFGTTGTLHFYPVKKDALWFSLALQAIEKKGSFPVVLNGANEEAVALFLDKHIGFGEILPLVQQVVKSHRYMKDVSVDDVFHLHNWAKQKARKITGDRQ